MPRIDVTALLKPVAQDPPCGPNLEYDEAFGELERAAQGKPERVMGDKVQPAEEPDWAEVIDLSAALLNRTKDLRVALHLVNAGLRVDGLAELASGLSLIRQLLVEQWDAVHPQLDKDDDNDPTLRLNTLVSLNDRGGIVGGLSRCTLIRSKTLGRVTLRDVRIASGDIPKPDGDVTSLDAAQVAAAFMDGDLAELQANAQAAKQSLDELQAINAHLNERVGVSRAPDLGGIVTEVRAIAGVLSDHLGRRGGSSVETAVAPTAANGPAIAVGDIKSRDDVVRVLDRICDYFQRNEPSSPVPLLLKRARRLVLAKDFMAVLNDLTPDALGQAKTMLGIEEQQD